MDTSVENWWKTNPMTYGEIHGKPDSGELGTPSFFHSADERFMQWNTPLHDNGIPFSRIFPYQRFKGKHVLEIGCGVGFMASCWAAAGAKMTAVDLNETSIEQTKARFRLKNLTGTIQKEDARQLSFTDNTYDYVYSWGVLHHSPNLERSLSEAFRVLKPGGEFGFMLYSRQSFQYWYHIKYLEGFLHGEANFLDDLQLASRYSDGHQQEGNPHTWPVTQKEVEKICLKHASSVKTKVLGTDLDATFKLMLPGWGHRLPQAIKKAWARRWGWSLWFSGIK